MEQQLTQSNNTRSIILEIKNAEKGVRLKDATDSQIKNCIKYIMLLIGITQELIPKTEVEKSLINFKLKQFYPNLTIDELTLAFDYALEKKFDTELKLFGSPISVLYISRVINDYLIWKKRQDLKEPEIQLHNTEKVKSIFNFLSQETKEALKEFGKPKEKPKEEPKHNELHQNWLRQFDLVLRKWEVKNTNGRFIHRYGKILDREQFFNYKANQYLTIQRLRYGK